MQPSIEYTKKENSHTQKNINEAREILDFLDSSASPIQGQLKLLARNIQEIEELSRTITLDSAKIETLKTESEKILSIIEDQLPILERLISHFTDDKDVQELCKDLLRYKMDSALKELNIYKDTT